MMENRECYLMSCCNEWLSDSGNYNFMEGRAREGTIIKILTQGKWQVNGKTFLHGHWMGNNHE